MRFTIANAAAYGSVGGKASVQTRKSRPPRKGPRSQVLALKDVAIRDAIAPDTPVGVRASLMRAYVDLHEIDMAIRGQGKPKPVEAKNSQSKRKSVGSITPIARASEPLIPPA